MLAALRALHEDAQVAMNTCGSSVRKSAFSVPAKNESAILKIAQRESNCNTTNTKTTAKLMFARYREGGLFISVKNFLRYGSDKLGTSG